MIGGTSIKVAAHAANQLFQFFSDFEGQARNGYPAPGFRSFVSAILCLSTMKKATFRIRIKGEYMSLWVVGCPTLNSEGIEATQNAAREV
jgi:hypothetical protein